MEHQCMAAALAVLGDKWNPLIVQSLEKGPARFCEIQNTPAGTINPRTLSGRLQRLEELEIIRKEVISRMPLRTEYHLTQRGRELLPILEAMIAWSARHGKP
ncbi:MAG: transcriptional regulator [Spirochaetaceae bacterium]|nr:MAG: transcriptional regulator [Spirochaetaceae bacterium]